MGMHADFFNLYFCKADDKVGEHKRIVNALQKEMGALWTWS